MRHLGLVLVAAFAAAGVATTAAAQESGRDWTFNIVEENDQLVAYGPWLTAHRLVPSDPGPGCM